MLGKKQLVIVLISGMVTFFLIALFMYMIYIQSKPNQVKIDPIVQSEKIETIIEEKQIVMAQQVQKILPSTNVMFEIVDQFGIVSHSENYSGVNWKDTTKIQIKQMFPDYQITKFEEDQVILTKLIERQITPNYILTINKENIIIAIDRNGHRIFYRDTGLGKRDVSDKLYHILQEGISITMEQKEAILRDSDELYVILQEHDE